MHFLIAENFWANWDPYQTTAQSQYRVNQQIYDYLVDPTGSLANPKAMLATSGARWIPGHGNSSSDRT